MRIGVAETPASPYLHHPYLHHWILHRNAAKLSQLLVQKLLSGQSYALVTC